MEAGTHPLERLFKSQMEVIHLAAGIRPPYFFQKPENQIMERVKRIELSSIAWEAIVLPLYYTRTSRCCAQYFLTLVRSLMPS